MGGFSGAATSWLALQTLLLLGVQKDVFDLKVWERERVIVGDLLHLLALLRRNKRSLEKIGDAQMCHGNEGRPGAQKDEGKDWWSSTQPQGRWKKKLADLRKEGCFICLGFAFDETGRVE